MIIRIICDFMPHLFSQCQVRTKATGWVGNGNGRDHLPYEPPRPRVMYCEQSPSVGTRAPVDSESNPEVLRSDQSRLDNIYDVVEDTSVNESHYMNTLSNANCEL